MTASAVHAELEARVAEQAKMTEEWESEANVLAPVVFPFRQLVGNFLVHKI